MILGYQIYFRCKVAQITVFGTSSLTDASTRTVEFPSSPGRLSAFVPKTRCPSINHRLASRNVPIKGCPRIAKLGLKVVHKTGTTPRAVQDV